MKPDGDVSRDDCTARQAGILLVAILLAGLALRVVAIGREPLWSDEALTAILVRYPWWSFPLTSVDATSPLFYWLEKALVPAGSSPVAWRLVSLAAGVATIPLTYWLTREMTSRVAGLVAAALVAVSAVLVDYSQEARAYALVVAMITGSAAALAALTGGRLRGGAKRAARRRMLALFATFTILAAFSQFIAILWVFPALYLLRMAAEGDRPHVTPREMVATVIALLPFLALEIRRQLVFRSEQSSFDWLTQPSPGRVLEILGDQWLPFAAAAGWPAALAGVALLGAMLWAVRRPLMRWVGARPLQPLILAVLLLGPLGLWLIGEVVAPVAMPRTFLPASIGFAALAGIAVALAGPRRRAMAGILIVGLALASTLVTGTTRRKEQWAGAAAAARGASLVVTCPNWKTPAFLAEAKEGGSVVTSYHQYPLLVRQPSDTATWDELYFQRVQRYGHYPMRRETPLTLERRAIATDRLLFVASDCSLIERRAFAKWAGLRQSRLLWSSPRTEHAADIRVEEWQLIGAPLNLRIVR